MTTTMTTTADSTDLDQLRRLLPTVDPAALTQQDRLALLDLLTAGAAPSGPGCRRRRLGSRPGGLDVPPVLPGHRKARTGLRAAVRVNPVDHTSPLQNLTFKLDQSGFLLFVQVAQRCL
jgi:hypothetical protein